MRQHVIGLKSEFEAEGLTQLEIADYFAQNVGPALRVVKIGGCEAKTDFRAAIRLGANVIVAPMVESWFAAQKFARMYPSSPFGQRWINIETVSGVEALPEILRVCKGEGISGVVIGRGDLAESLGLNRAQVDSEVVHRMVTSVADASKEAGMHVGVGGMISTDSIPNLENLIQGEMIDHFETRKTLLSATAEPLIDIIQEGLLIESNWIKSSIENLQGMSRDLSSRLSRLQAQLGNQDED